MKARRLLDLCLLIALFTLVPRTHQGRLLLAYSPIIDGAAGDWTGAPPPYDNLGHLSRSAAHEGEYIWRDLAADERTDFAVPDTGVDLVEFRVTADRNALYFMAKMTNISQAAGSGAPQIQVAIDTDQVDSSGEPFLGGLADTAVDPQAEWEYLAITRFGSNNPHITLWQNGFSTYVVTGTAAISDLSETIEFSLPRPALGMAAVPAHPLRFTVATFRCDSTDQTWDIGGTSDALDALTNYGDPGDTGSNTIDEVSDGVQNYYFDLFFEADGDVYAPLLISEVLYDPSGSEPAAEFIEILNQSPYPVDLTAYKIGDEESVGGKEGMVRFPSGTLPAATLLVLANNAGTFLNTYAFLPDYALNSGGEPVPGMLPYPTWATSAAVSLSNDGDEVLLLDGRGTVIDVVEYEDDTPEWTDLAGTTFAAPDGSSMERRPAEIDTNDMARDFYLGAGDGTPGRAVVPRLYLPLLCRDDWSRSALDGATGQ